jgi:hypothetical protein
MTTIDCVDWIEMKKPPAADRELSEEEREWVLELARRELPELDRRYKKAMTNLNRIARGLRPKA